MGEGGKLQVSYEYYYFSSYRWYVRGIGNDDSNLPGGPSGCPDVFKEFEWGCHMRWMTFHIFYYRNSYDGCLQKGPFSTGRKNFLHKTIEEGKVFAWLECNRWQ